MLRVYSKKFLFTFSFILKSRFHTHNSAWTAYNYYCCIIIRVAMVTTIVIVVGITVVIHCEGCSGSVVKTILDQNSEQQVSNSRP